VEIKLLRRDQIDDAQWNARVEQSGNGLPYALTPYLDIVSGRQWEALVSDNYTAIFPLPFEVKLGLKLYLQPPFTQQLGMIAEEYSEELELSFWNAISKNINSLHLKTNEFSSINSVESYRVNKRTNFVSSLKSDYQSIQFNYSKSLRKRIKKATSLYRIEISEDASFLVSFYRNEMEDRVGLSANQYKTAEKLISYLVKHKLGNIYQAKNGENIEGILFVINYQNRIINLFGTSNQEGKRNHAMHFILDHIIKTNCESDKYFDFEGSDLKGVKEFYQSFGPEVRSYSEFEMDRLPLWFRVFKRVKAVLR